MKPLSLVVAVAANRCIGKSGGHLGLPWHIPEDLKHFKKLTTGHAIIMGRKTYELIGRPLPNRRSIVISRNCVYRPEGVEVAPNLEAALAMAYAGGDQEPAIIGGASVYQEALPLVTTAHVTEVQEAFEGDTFFPPWNRDEWEETERRPGEDPRVVFVTYRRKSAV
jgi:dihydrofolate reductase